MKNLTKHSRRNQILRSNPDDTVRQNTSGAERQSSNDVARQIDSKDKNYIDFVRDLFTEFDPHEIYSRAEFFYKIPHKGRARIFSFLLYKSQQHSSLYYTYEMLGKVGNVSHRTTLRIIQEMDKLQLVRRIRREKFKTCLYIVNPALNIKWVQERLSSAILSSFDEEIANIHPLTNNAVREHLRDTRKAILMLRKGNRQWNGKILNKDMWSFAKLVYNARAFGLTHVSFKICDKLHIFHVSDFKFCDNSCINNLLAKPKRYGKLGMRLELVIEQRLHNRSK